MPLLVSPVAGAQTGETAEIVYSGADAQPLRDQAAALGNPATMYEYVHNTIEFSPYHGSRSGSVNTFLGQRGSDVDIATTLIAMLRSQGIPARYAVGTARLPAAQLTNWLGIGNLDVAVQVLKDQGIQGVTLAADRSTVDFEHAWTEAFVAFDQYRGVNTVNPAVDCALSANAARCTWVALDASFKQKTYNGLSLDPYNAVSFDYTAYYNAIKNNDAARRDKNPLAILEDQIGAWLRTNYPGKTLEDVADAGEIVEIREGLLPASLPYQVIGTVRRYDSVAAHDAAVPATEPKKWGKTVRVGFRLVSGGLTIQAGGTPVLLAEVNTKRLTMTTEFVGTGNVPNMVVRLGGTEISRPISGGGTISGYTPAIGDPFTILVSMDGRPGATSSEADLTISAEYSAIIGGYYLVATGGESSNWSQVHRAADQLLAANDQYKIVFNPGEAGCLPDGANCTPYVDASGNGWDASDIKLLENKPALDALTGGLLYVGATQYYAKLREQFERADRLMKTKTPVIGFLGVVSSVYEAEYIDGTAFSILPGGLLIDMKGITIGGAYRTNEAAVNYANRQFEFLGHITSSLEHETWQELTGYDAVSTVRGIQMALAGSASLLNVKRDQTTNTVPQFLTAAGFGATAPAPFSLSVRDIYSTRPTTWSHPTTTAVEGFDILKKSPTSVSDTRLSTLGYYNNYWHGNLGCFDDIEGQLNSLRATYGGSAALNAASVCGVSWSDGTTIDQAITIVRNGYNSYRGGANAAFFNYLDALQGFDYAAFGYRSKSLAASAYSTNFVAGIRNDLQLRDVTLSWVEYALPSTLVTGANYRFEVDIRKSYTTSSGRLSSLSFEIANRGLTAGGGYVAFPAGAAPSTAVDAKEGKLTMRPWSYMLRRPVSFLTLVAFGLGTVSPAYAGGYVDGNVVLNPAKAIASGGISITPTFNNDQFNDKVLVGTVNNDPVRTPSTADPVSTVSGNNYHDETDLVIRGRNGLNTVFTRTYNSAPSSTKVDRGLGYGWTHSYLMRLKSNDFGDCPNCASAQKPENANSKTSSITYTDERGGEQNYPVNETSYAVTAPKGVYDILTLDSPSAGQHTLAFRNGVKYIFEVPAGSLKTTPNVTARLKYIDNPWGDRLTLAYDGAGRLATITDNLGIAGRSGLAFTYDAAGRLDKLTDWSGRVWDYSVDASGHLTACKNPLNQTLTYTYAAGHRLKDVIKPVPRNGVSVKTTFKYYQNGRTFQQLNSFDQGDTLDYDLYRKSTRVTDARGGVREYFYDADGRMTKLAEPDGGVLLFENQGDAIRSKKYDALGYATSYSYRNDKAYTGSSDAFGNVTRQQDALSGTVDTTYGPLDQIATTKDKRGTVSTTTYGTGIGGCDYTNRPKETRLSALAGSSNVLLSSQCWNSNATLNYSRDYINATRYRETRLTYQAGTNGLNVSQVQTVGMPSGITVTRTYAYDNLGRKLSETLKRRTSPTNATLINLTTSYDYDALDRVIKVTDPLGNEVINNFDANGQLWKVTHRYKKTDGTFDVRDVITRSFDAADRVKTETDAEGNTTSYSYDEAGNVIAVLDAEGHTTRVEYDAMNRRTAVIDATGYRTETAYTLRGDVVAVTNANGETVKFEIDALGRKTAVIDAKGYRTEYQYDPNGNLTCAVDANAQAGLQPKNSLGCSESRSYDELNRLIKITDALNGETSFTYDLAGNRLAVRDAEAKTWTFAYDDLGRLTSETDHSAKTLSYKSDEGGNVYEKTNRLAEVTRYTFDAGNRLTRVDYLKDGSAETFGYDAAGNRNAAANSTVGYSFSWDRLNRLTGRPTAGAKAWPSASTRWATS